jgi:hypothetical protein
LRRQFGADAVKLDTIGGKAWCAFLTPKNLDFSRLKEAVAGAGYTLYGVEVTAGGRIGRAAGDGPWTLKAHGTGQVYHLDLKEDWKGSENVRVTGRIIELKQTPPQVTVQKIVAES